MTLETPIRSDDPTGTLPGPTAPDAAAAPSHVRGLRCRACGRAEDLGPSFVCAACFGPLEIVYDHDVARERLTHASIAARAPGIWRYLELLPVGAVPERGLAVGSTALVRAARLGRNLGLGSGTTLHLKDDTRNPTLSFKDRVVAVATARAVEFGFDTLACASTGNLAGATAAAAAAAGLRAFVFVPADLEPAKVEHALAYGATVVRVDGTYDDINRLSLEIADEEGWAFVNVNLRPFYAEGSKTIAFEVAEQLGWRLPDVIVGPIASGSMFTKIAKGFDELVEIGLVEPRDVRFVGGQAAGCAPVATAFAEGVDEIRPVRLPDTIVRSLAIGSPADGPYALELARRTGGSIESIPDAATAAAIRSTAATEGIFVETAGGVTVAAVEAARARGVIRDGDEVVAILSGNGVKTPDARRFGEPTDGGFAAPIPATYTAFSERYPS
ncbi:MAG: threonine synthase [Chloroflexota bacterium]|nr:threonine synthase [Chloroflexota bacterium]